MGVIHLYTLYRNIEFIENTLPHTQFIASIYFSYRVSIINLSPGGHVCCTFALSYIVVDYIVMHSMGTHIKSHTQMSLSDAIPPPYTSYTKYPLVHDCSTFIQKYLLYMENIHLSWVLYCNIYLSIYWFRCNTTTTSFMCALRYHNKKITSGIIMTIRPINYFSLFHIWQSYSTNGRV